MASRKGIIISLAAIITALFFYQWWQYQVQYQLVLVSLEEYQSLVDQESGIIEEWQEGQAKKKKDFREIGKKFRNLNFRFYNLKTKVEGLPVNDRFKGISDAKKNLSAAIDDNIKQLVLLSTIDFAEIKGELNRVEKRDYYQLLAAASAHEDRAIDLMFAYRTAPDLTNTFNRLRGLRRFFNNYP